MSEALPVRKDDTVSVGTRATPDVPAGYSHTNLGLVPEGWDNRLLRDDISLLSGHHVPARHCNNQGIGTPYLTGPADFPNGRINHTSYTVQPTTLCSTDDILVTVKGAGAGTLIQADSEYCISRQLMAIRPASWNTEFLYYSLLQNAPRFRAASTGLIPGLSRSDILDQQLPVPRDLGEQRAIAEALSDVDGLLESLDALIAKKRAIKSSAMQQLLTGKIRLKEACGSNDVPARYKRTKVGMMPEDWEVTPFRSCLCAPLDYGVNAAAVPFDDELPTYLRITDIDEESRYRPSPRVSVNHPDSDSYVLSKGDLVFARTGASVGKSYLHDPADGALVFAGFLVRARPEPAKLDSTYCAYVVQSERYWKWVAAMSSRSGQPGINGQEYGSFPLPLPKIREQRAIAAILSDMDAEIAGLESHRDKTLAVKHGMMQQLLTGRVRLV